MVTRSFTSLKDFAAPQTKKALTSWAATASINLSLDMTSHTGRLSAQILLLLEALVLTAKDMRENKVSSVQMLVLNDNDKLSS